ncbi:MAG: glycosyltransferase family 2 protein [Lentisphaerae bacterium]|nr:glycosyltransferase family 2 protein [Lentisphaerota bacterium]
MKKQRTKKNQISVCIITGNEELNIRRCLESVTWADEIIVVDSFSKDKTVSIVKEYTERVYEHRWLGYIGQKAVAKSLATCEWVLFVDADEVVSDDLRIEIETLAENGFPDDVNGYEFPRLVWFLGRWIRHGDWYPDSKLRLFRRKRGKCGGTEPHERIEIEGEMKSLTAPLYHYTYKNISDQVNTLNRFSTISADGFSRNRPKYKIIAGMLVNAPFRFFRCYIIKGGFLDGIPGLIIAVAASFATIIKYAKQWERCQTNKK